ncbi:MAG: SAM-dependent methyltransferase [Actinomycetota bacterium]|nr:SAM-dependent methyltransferase [Actinomycetota bacterium]
MSDDRITMSEIARRIEVTLPAVSNWRRRHPSFPIPKETGGKELFVAAEVAEWLDGRKISKKDIKDDELPGATYGARFRATTSIPSGSGVAIRDDLWREFDRCRGMVDIAVLTDLVLGLLYLAAVDERCWNAIVAADGESRARLVASAADKHALQLEDLDRAVGRFLADPTGATRLAEIIQLVDRIRRSGQTAEAFEFLVNQFAVSEGRRGPTVHTPRSVTRLLVDVLAPEPTASVFDPSCGSGGFLLKAAEYMAAHYGPASGGSFTGHALSARSASLARMNLLIHGVPAEVDADAAAPFRGGRELIASKRFNVVMSNPPFDLKAPTGSAAEPYLHGRYGSLPKNRTSFAWLQYAVSALKDDGWAAVIMPGGTLFRGGAEREIRARMIDDDVVQAIIALPSALFASTGIPVTVWLLNNPAGKSSGEILLIDASDLGHMISRTQRTLSGEDSSRIADCVTKWRTGHGYQNVPGFSASVAIDRIRAEDYVLIPARYVGRSGALDIPAKSVSELRDELVALERRAAAADEAVARQLDGIQAWTP